MRKLLSPNIAANGILWVVALATQIGGWVNRRIAIFLLLLAFLWTMYLVKHWFKKGNGDASEIIIRPRRTTETIPSRREALESALVAWGLWHTGTRIRIEHLLKCRSLKRILILEPNVDSDSVSIIAKRSGESKESIISELRATTKEALSNGKDIRWYPEHRESSFTIHDPTPVKGLNGILKPCSKDAWIYVEYLNPKVGVDQRKSEIIRNSGRDEERFTGFYEEYEDTWNRSVPGKAV